LVTITIGGYHDPKASARTFSDIAEKLLDLVEFFRVEIPTGSN
jgi:hypothetical protein